jgi:pimeloyl-ACP methyl ester carboxylesterase
LRGKVSERLIHHCFDDKYKQKQRLENARKQKKLHSTGDLAAIVPLNDWNIDQQEKESRNTAFVEICLQPSAARTDTTASLSKVNIPTFLLVGEHDQLHPPAVRAMHDKISKSKYRIISNAGHMANLKLLP